KIAEVYFNGKHIGTLKGIMERGIYDITPLLRKSGKNAVAVLITPPRNDPKHNHGLANWESPTYLSSASWDWMPEVPGLNSGITDTVAITTAGPVSINDPYIKTELPDKHQANLSISAQLHNSLPQNVKGVLKATINPGNIVIKSNELTLGANSDKVVSYDKKDFPALSIRNPKLWWPNGYGAKPLYTCKVEFEVSGTGISDVVSKKFGIRKISADTTTLKGPWRLYVNDVPILIKGGNWGMSDYMLKVRGKDYEPRIKLHKEMNFNMIRNWTGEVTDEAFYDYCDRYGIMVWDDFWLNNMGGIDSLGIFKRNAVEKVKKLRNHPSVAIWCGANEGVPGGDPNGAISQAIKQAIAENDGSDRLYFPRSNAGVTNPNFSIHGGSHNLSGSGIWGNVDPKTYFTDPHNGYLFSRDSYGLRSELGMAAFVNVESFKKFMPKDYWVPPTPEAVDSKTNMWARHYFSTDGALGGGSNPVRYINDINKIYGKATSLEDFCRKAQLMNLETMKAMYEAWNDHLWNDASGMLIWMSQSAYPTMIWQTYDYYYDLTGTYFGAKTACEPVHIQWNAATNSVKVINNKAYSLKGLVAEATVYNMDGKIAKNHSKKAIMDIDPSSAEEAFVVFDPSTKGHLSDVHFLKLKLFDAQGKLLSENFYWTGNTYLDYTALQKLPHIGDQLKTGKPAITKASDGNRTKLTYTIINTSSKGPAFSIRAQLLDNKGRQILPAIFDDGYFTLMPNEKKVLHVEVDPKLLRNGYKLSVRAFNN
ncbi:MAG TPA: glycoside hydrolase family 2 TIM barrel-domain containing protein, partial [Mucilaginibacter sp.]|nr:glycoside hydrolase family 2 TIM barrel-domain containing protein [Mucilaginibacter sp.]